MIFNAFCSSCSVNCVVVICYKVCFYLSDVKHHSDCIFLTVNVELDF